MKKKKFPVIQVIGLDADGEKVSQASLHDDGSAYLLGRWPSYMLTRIRQLERNEYIFRFVKQLEENIGELRMK